jgi:hypothetical protein
VSCVVCRVSCVVCRVSCVVWYLLSEGGTAVDGGEADDGRVDGGLGPLAAVGHRPRGANDPQALGALAVRVRDLSRAKRQPKGEKLIKNIKSQIRKYN